VRLLRRLIKTTLFLGAVAGIAVVAKNGSSFLKTPTTEAAPDVLDESADEEPTTDEGSL
jgi:hypothetical protein